MIKVKRWDVINWFIQRYDYKSYLEIGYGSGTCFREVRCDYKMAVDPDPKDHSPIPRGRVQTCSSDEFFENMTASQSFDIVFIDGLHHADQVLRDVQNALHHLNPGGTILLHDCNPQTEEAQRVPQPPGQTHWNGDCWKVVAFLRVVRKDLNVATINVGEGIGVVRRNPIALDYMWDELERNREQILGLVGIEELDSWLDTSS